MLERQRLLALLSAALVAMSVAVLAACGVGEDGVRALIRASARTSLVLFLLAFTASSLRTFAANEVTAWLLRNRRYIGLSFAVSHLLHLAAIADVAIRWPHPFMEQSAQPLTIVGGGAGYLALTLMTVTSMNGAVRKLGAARWRALHLAGSWILWIIFAESYLGRAVVSPWYAPAALAIVGAAVLRTTAWHRRRRQRRPASLEDASSLTTSFPGSPKCVPPEH
jgi:sulfoxide reductase heme-binding subunit YedZ